MFIYIVLFVYLSFLVYKYDVKRKKDVNKRLHYMFSCFILILVAGFRYRIGYDTINYMEKFLYAPSLREIFNGSELQGDILWAYIIGISKEICDDFFIVQFIQAIIVNCIVFWFIKRHSPKPFVAVFLYFMLGWWNLCFEAMREAIAVSFYLYALDAILSNKGLKIYYLRVWPALLVHTFGFVTLFFPLIKFLNIKKHALIICSLVFFLIFLVKDSMNELFLLMELTTDIGGETSNFVLDKATKYVDSDTYGESNMSIGGLLSLFVGNILPCIYIIMLLNRHSKVCNQNWVSFVFVYICICVLKTQVPIFYRFLNYFEILVIVAYTNVLFYEKLKIRRQIASAFIVIMVLVRMYSLKSNDADTNIPAYYRYVPYNSIFQQNYNKNSEIIFSN